MENTQGNLDNTNNVAALLATNDETEVLLEGLDDGEKEKQSVSRMLACCDCV